MSDPHEEEVSLVVTLYGKYKIQAGEDGRLTMWPVVRTASVGGDEHRVKYLAAISGGSDNLAQATALNILIDSASFAIGKWRDELASLDTTGADSLPSEAAPTGVLN